MNDGPSDCPQTEEGDWGPCVTCLPKSSRACPQQGQERKSSCRSSRVMDFLGVPAYVAPGSKGFYCQRTSSARISRAAKNTITELKSGFLAPLCPILGGWDGGPEL